ncbi:MAG: late competence development ComFB family protein [Treponema sp.]|nr:late competence development ComFB family protein [Treponema sp.]
MNIHNSMEEAVTSRVNEIFDQLKNEHITWLTCDCENCRLDTICYVLNRTQPKYYVSERGMLHSTLDMDDSQLKTDITAIAMEGIRIINGSHRSYHSGHMTEKPSSGGKYYYNFPVLMGAVYNGENFEPLDGVSVSLKMNGEDVAMSDSTWSNPAKTYKATKGNYTFWPASIEADKDEGPKVFKFTFEISRENFVSSTYAIEVPVVAETVKKITLDSSFSLKIKDIFLFDKNSENPME